MPTCHSSSTRGACWWSSFNTLMLTLLWLSLVSSPWTTPSLL